MRLKFWPVIFLGLLLSGCSGADDAYTWGWHILSPLTDNGQINLKFLASGFIWTLSLSISAFILAMTIGFLIALPGLSEKRSIRIVNRFYVEVFRAIPVLVMLLWIYYGLPVVLGIEMSAFAAALLALALCESAFHAEIFRGGIQSIHKGQAEAAKALGLSRWRTMQKVILPQAIRQVLPPLGNQFVYMLKMSSLASVIGVQELTRRANELQINEYRAMEIYSFLVLEYLIIVLIFSFLARRLEKAMAYPN
ncbi:amino acid ABC transporter permease [Spongorhabdus nitratireducens]